MPMWTKVAKFIISYRLYLIVVIGLVTVMMGYYGTRVELSYEFARTVPPNDPEQIRYGCFVPDLTGLATASSAELSSAI